jgi:hypothetical protein
MIEDFDSLFPFEELLPVCSPGLKKDTLFWVERSKLLEKDNFALRSELEEAWDYINWFQWCGCTYPGRSCERCHIAVRSGPWLKRNLPEGRS